MTNETPTVFVVDDDLAVRSALRRLLTAAGYKVEALASAKHLFENGRPDSACCLVLDVGLPDVDGLAFQEALARAGVQVPIIFITGRGDIPMSVRAMKAGAVDFLAKPFDRAQLLACVIAALAQDTESRAQRRQLADLKQRYETLSPRECEVFAAVASGMLNKQVGFELGVVEKTIKVHRAHVMEKMQAVAIADLVRMADMLGLRWTEDGAQCLTESGTVATYS
jgi:FixJ family two-component response regulator